MQANYWENRIADYLQDLSLVQDELFGVLAKKRECLANVDTVGLASLAPEEEKLIEKLQTCIHRREEMLTEAKKGGVEAENLQEVLQSVSQDKKGSLPHRILEAQRNTRLLRNQSVVNWLIIQKTILHISQVLQIIATGGRLQPTYGEEEALQGSGSLIDGAA